MLDSSLSCCIENLLIYKKHQNRISLHLTQKFHVTVYSNNTYRIDSCSLPQCTVPVCAALHIVPVQGLHWEFCIHGTAWAQGEEFQLISYTYTCCFSVFHTHFLQISSLSVWRLSVLLSLFPNLTTSSFEIMGSCMPFLCSLYQTDSDTKH